MISDNKLARWYRESNARFFGGELPDVPIWWEPCGTAMAVTLPVSHDPLELAIKIDPFMAQASVLVRQTIIHEQIHVLLWSHRGLADHGARFDKELQRLCGLRSYRKLL